MKRYILMILALVLIVASFITMQETAASMISAGAGDDENAQIESFKQLEGVFNLVSQRTGGSSYYADDDYSSEKDEKNYKYDSVTMHEETSGSSYSHDSGAYELNTKYNSSLTIYMAKKDTYIINKGMISYSRETFGSDGDLTEQSCVFDLEFYNKGNNYYIKVNTFIMKLNGHEKVDMTDILGKWVKVEEEAYNQMLSIVDSFSRSQFEDMFSLVEAGKDEFDKSGDVYSIEESFSEDGVSMDSSVAVDLSNPETPSLSLKGNYEADGGYSRAKNFITFSNIDNTVIDVDFKGVEKIDMDEFEEFFKEADDE